MNQLRALGSPEATMEMWSLANGPMSQVNFYQGCDCNGVRFHSKDKERCSRSQSSGLVVEGDYEGDKHDYYGYLCKVWELSYRHGGKVVLFECEWYNTSTRQKINIEDHVTSIDITGRWCTDDPFVLPGQAAQVFYVNDTSRGKNWRVVERVKPRGLWDVPAKCDDDNDECDTPNDAFQQDETTFVVPVLVDGTSIPHSIDDIDPEIILGDESADSESSEEDETLAEYEDETENAVLSEEDDDFECDM